MPPFRACRLPCEWLRRNPSYRAYYGRALAANQQTQRLAEAELQAAVKLDPANASYRVMLAELYRTLGFLAAQSQSWSARFHLIQKMRKHGRCSRLLK